MSKPIRTYRGFARANNGLPTVNVGKSSKWNTPFQVREVNGMYMVETCELEAKHIIDSRCHNPYRTQIEARKAAYEAYGYWMLPENKSGSLSEFYAELMHRDKELQKLKGKNLMCGCEDEVFCHAEMLLQIVNS